MDSFAPSFLCSFPASFAIGTVEYTLSEQLLEGLTSEFTFVRPGAVGWRRNTSGVWLDDVGVDGPRFHHDASGNPLGLLMEGYAVNYFDTPAAPANQTIDLTTPGTGDYTLFIEGTGSVAVAAGTATGTGFGTATEGSPITFNLTVAGTVTITVTGSPDRANVHKSARVTTFILDAAAGTARQAESCTFTTDGIIPANDFGIYAEITPVGDPAAASSYFGVSEDTNNWFDFGFSAADKITLTKKVAGVSKFGTYTGGVWSAGQTLKVAARVSSVSGIAVWVDGTKGSVTDADTTDINVTGAGYIGSNRLGSNASQGSIKNLKIITDPTLLTDERLALRTSW